MSETPSSSATPTPAPESAGRVVQPPETAVRSLYPATRLLKGNLHELDDHLRKAKQELDATRAEAERVRSTLDEELKQLRGQACREGRDEALAEFRGLLATLHQHVVRRQDELAIEVDNLVCTFAETILRTELSINRDAMVRLVRSVLERAKCYAQITVVVHPDVIEQIRSHRADFLDQLPFASDIQLKGEPDLPRHGCRVETELGTFDGSLHVQLQRLQEKLRDLHPVESAPVPLTGAEAGTVPDAEHQAPAADGSSDEASGPNREE